MSSHVANKVMLTSTKVMLTLAVISDVPSVRQTEGSRWRSL